ncbi:MAG: hypothetical protein EKK48_12200 [Candidatus Melainabacteria bacterium]|nr:MAG: hypothetical protein EKK48_12200 [Candidatus Melainabacteria bacterium]
MPAKSYFVIFLCACIFFAWALNAYTQISVTGRFEPHWTLIFFVLYFIGHGVFEFSVKSISEVRKWFLPAVTEVQEVLVDEVTGTHKKIEVDAQDVEPIEGD